uniref:Uncharacterized protein n=1 Tax=Anguilla anguilla TaxID=7936 RepID=A0A0E9PA79_ANGAN
MPVRMTNTLPRQKGNRKYKPRRLKDRHSQDASLYQNPLRCTAKFCSDMHEIQLCQENYSSTNANAI